MTFADNQKGWIGTLSSEQRMYSTTNGGQTWEPVLNLPPGGPKRVCGIHAVNDQVIWASGTNNPADQSPAVFHTTDGGVSWQVIDLSAYAINLIDIYFKDENCGWVVGGYTTNPNPTYADPRPVILYTDDAGKTWTNLIADQTGSFPEGSWGWKIFFVSDTLAFVSVESFTLAWVFKSTDGGMTWAATQIPNNQDLEGVGFLTEQHGWAGGWGLSQLTGTTTETTDGGLTWTDVTQQDHNGYFFELKYLNRFRILRNSDGSLNCAYASGKTVYKYTAGEPPIRPDEVDESVTGYMSSTMSLTGVGSFTFSFSLPRDVTTVSLHLFTRFGIRVKTLLDGPPPVSGSITWDGTDDDGHPVSTMEYLYRMTVQQSDGTETAQAGVFYFFEQAADQEVA